ncbi:hypothetical protein [uncultured Methanospirillum sp.]|uniref:hypothetical protein n=1 Tax=uncultured Methanospirillum sp. TaxID=262503 RepID=UPI0029C93A48|nr:hypothetical protein [uncultured Methanospirillum sp.]
MVGVSDESSELPVRLVLLVREVPSDADELSAVSVLFEASEREAKAAVRVVSSSADPDESDASELVVFAAGVVVFDEDVPDEEEADDVEFEADSDENVSTVGDVSGVVESEEEEEEFVAGGEPVAGVEGLPDEDVSVVDEPVSVVSEVLSDEDVSDDEPGVEAPDSDEDESVVGDEPVSGVPEALSDEDVPVEPDVDVSVVPDEDVSVAGEPDVDVADAPVSGVPESEEEEVSPEDALTPVSVEFPSAHTPGVATAKRMTRMRSDP